MFAISLGAALAALVWIYAGPGGRLVPLFLITLGASLVAYYAGFVDRRPNPLRFLAQAGAITLFLLTLLIAHVSRLDRRGAEIVAGLIAPYPRIDQVRFLPLVDRNQLQHWMLTTADSETDVVEFYALERNRAGWELLSPPPLMVLGREGEKLTVFISGDRRETTITLDLRRAP